MVGGEELTGGSGKLPPTPYDSVAEYTLLLGNPDDFRPQVNGVIVRTGGRELTSARPTKIPDISWIDGSCEMEIVLPYPTHEGAVSALMISAVEHLNLAATGFSISRGDVSFEHETLSIADMSDRYGIELEEPIDSRLDKVYALTLWKKAEGKWNKQLLLFFQPSTVVQNPEDYEHHPDRVFFAHLYNVLTVQFVDQSPQMAQFIAKFALSGFPRPNRRMPDEA